MLLSSPNTITFPSAMATLGAVAARVVPVVVQAFDRVAARRAFAHIREKVFKMQPALTNRYAAFPIMFVARGALIKTTLFNAAPNFVYGMIRHIVRCIAFFQDFCQTTSTALFAGAEMILTYRLNGAARALTPPEVVLTAPQFSGIPQDGQAKEPLSSQVSEEWCDGMGNGGKLIVGHFANSPQSWISNLARLCESVSALRRAVFILT